MRRLLSSLSRDEAGSALAEAAITIPILVLIGFGLLEFGNIFYQYQAVTTGVRDAARYLARAPLRDDPNDTCVIAINRRVADAQRLAVSGNVYSATPARIPGWGPGDVVATPVQVANPLDAITGSPTYRGPTPFTCMVTVTSNFGYQQFGLLRMFNVPAISISVSHTERWIGG